MWSVPRSSRPRGRSSKPTLPMQYCLKHPPPCGSQTHHIMTLFHTQSWRIFFLVWLRRALPELQINDPYSPSNALSPKVQECVWNQGQSDDQGNPKTPSFFERKFSDATAIGRQTLSDDGVACVVFAHKSTDGWEALLTGLTAGGLIVSASWPIVAHHHRIGVPRQHHAAVPAAQIAGAEPGRKHLVVPAPDLPVEPRLRQLRRHRRCGVSRLEQAHRQALENHVDWYAQMGTRRSNSMTVGINA